MDDEIIGQMQMLYYRGVERKSGGGMKRDRREGERKRKRKKYITI